MSRSYGGGGAMKKKPTRAQGRAPSDDPVLRRAVKKIRRLKKSAASHGKAFLADIVKIGKELSANKDRVGHGYWLAWLHKNFDWSGETATNYMNLAELSKTPEFQSLQNSPTEALYFLARRTMSSETRADIAQRVDAGELPTLDEIRRRTREPEIRLTSSSSADSSTRRQFGYYSEPADAPKRPVLNITDTASPPKPTKQLTSEDLHRAAAERFPQWLADVARGLVGFEPLAETAAVLPAKHSRVDEDADRIMRFLDEFRRARHDQRRELKAELKVVRSNGAGGKGGGGDDGTGAAR